MRSDSLLIRLYRFSQNKKAQLIYLPLAVYWIVLLIATSLPTDSLPSIGGSDKIKHFGAYFILTFLLSLAIHFQEKYQFLKTKFTLSVLIISISYGIFDELHQYFIPGRYCDIWDLVANIGGAILAILVVNFMLQKINRSVNLKSKESF